MQEQSLTGRIKALNMLVEAWNKTASGIPQVLVIEGPKSSGHSSLVTRMIETADVPAIPIPLRMSFNEGEDGLKVLLRMYAELYVSLHSNPELHASIQSHLEAEHADAQEPRKLWLLAFKEGMERDKPDTSQAKFEVTVPRQSPYLALLEIMRTISAKHPLLIEFGNVDHILSFTFWTFVTVLLNQIHREKLPIQVVLWGEPISEADLEAIPFAPRLAVLESLPSALPVQQIVIGAMTQDESTAALNQLYPENRFSAELAARLYELSGGLPERQASLCTLLESRQLLLKADDNVWVFNGEVVDFEPADFMTHMPGDNQAQTEDILRIAAMEGPTFTAKVIAEQLQLDKDTVDDTLDELEDFIDEVAFHEPLESWLYRFKSSVMQHWFAVGLSPAARKEQAKALAELLERNYLAKAVEYAVKSARLWKDAGDLRRSKSLIGLAASSERADILQMGAELAKGSPEATFPTSIYKGLHLTLLEKVSASGPIDVLMTIVDDMAAWGESHQDDELKPWLAFYRARLHHRRGELAEAQQAGTKAQKGFARGKNPVKEADAFNLLAQIALSRGDVGVANENLSRALKKTEFPPIHANSLLLKGVVHKAKGELQLSLDHLKKALEMSGRIGLLPLHIDAGINISEVLLMGGKADDAANLLTQLVDVARRARAPERERGVLSALAKTSAARKDIAKALESASAALQISRNLKRRNLEAADLMDLGIFNLVGGKAAEAGVYLREAEKIARELNAKRLLKEVLFHQGLVHTSSKDYSRALGAYDEALTLVRELKDQRREGNILFNIGGVCLHQGELARARTNLDESAPLIEQFGTPDEKKALQKAREQLELKLN